MEREQKTIEVAVLSLPRNGTLGLHMALEILGYTSYHFSTAMDEDKPDLALIRAGQDARLWGRGTPFDFDKLFRGRYNAVVEIPAMVDPAAFLLAHPTTLVILTTRPPSSWVRSYNATIGARIISSRALSSRILALFSPFMRDLVALQRNVAHEWAGGLDTSSPAGRAHMEAFYERHAALVRHMVPPERLLELRLDGDELGWERVCGFLGREVPRGVEWPMKHRPDEFGKTVERLMRPVVRRAMGRMVAFVVGVLGVLLAMAVALYGSWNPSSVE